MKRKLNAEKEEDSDDVAKFLEEEDSDTESNAPPTKRRKIDAGHHGNLRRKIDADKTEEDAGMKWMNADSNEKMPDDIPFTQEELEEDWDEDAFMEKLSSYLEQKYDDKDYDYGDNPDEAKTNDHGLSAEDLLTMDEDELNKLIPVNEEDVVKEFKYIPSFGAQSLGSESKRRSNHKRRKQKSYYKVPAAMNKSKGKRKKNRQSARGTKSSNVTNTKNNKQ